MLRHIVMYRFLPEAGGRTREENLAEAVALAQRMEKEIPQLRAFQYGVNSRQADGGNYDITLVCDLDSFEALAEYKQNPAHKAFGTLCHAVSSDRAAIDFEL